MKLILLIIPILFCGSLMASNKELYRNGQLGVSVLASIYLGQKYINNTVVLTERDRENARLEVRRIEKKYQLKSGGKIPNDLAEKISTLKEIIETPVTSAEELAIRKSLIFRMKHLVPYLFFLGYSIDLIIKIQAEISTQGQ